MRIVDGQLIAIGRMQFVENSIHLEDGIHWALFDARYIADHIRHALQVLVVNVWIERRVLHIHQFAQRRRGRSVGRDTALGRFSSFSLPWTRVLGQS